MMLTIKVYYTHIIDIMILVSNAVKNGVWPLTQTHMKVVHLFKKIELYSGIDSYNPIHYPGNDGIRLYITKLMSNIEKGKWLLDNAVRIDFYSINDGDVVITANMSERKWTYFNIKWGEEKINDES